MRGIRAFMGRRQFLKGALATSAAGLTSKIAMGPFKPGTKAAWAGVAETAGASEVSGEAGVFSDRYCHMLSPLKIGNVVLKNRFYHTRSMPHFLMGPEIFPSEQIISHYATVARSAAVVTCRAPQIPPRDRSQMDPEGDLCHMTFWHIQDPSVQNYFSQLADAIHFYDAKASFGITLLTPEGYTISNAPNVHMDENHFDYVYGTDAYDINNQLLPKTPGEKPPPGKEIPVELMQEIIDDAVMQCKLYQGLGFDMVNIYMSYRAHMLAHALSPVLNTRTDKYGGSLENRARFPLELFQAIKKACGPDFLVEAQVSGEEPAQPAGGFTIEDVVEYARIWEGSLDILQLRAETGGKAHPMGWNSEKEKPVTLQYSEAVKKSGVNIVTAPIGGYQDLDLNNSYIASGKADMIAMARAYICDPEYGQKAAEGRGEDVVPCIKCNKCHGDSFVGPWVSFCSVNPKLGIAHRVGRMVDPPVRTQKVAVIGGGPAGMKAAVVAAERGHKVTIYEKRPYLGGLLHHADFAPMRWPLREFKDYLVRQVKKNGIEVLMETEATPEKVKAKGYDAVIVAVGATPIIPRIPGADSDHVWNVGNVYPNEKALGKNVVVVGSGEFGAGTGGYLAQTGHKVTVLASGKELIQRAGPHQIEIMLEALTELPNFNFITEAIVTGISEGKVTYTDAAGKKKSISADDVVVYAGLKSRKEEVLKFVGAAPRFFTVGDCREVGNVRTCNRTAYGAASQI